MKKIEKILAEELKDKNIKFIGSPFLKKDDVTIIVSNDIYEKIKLRTDGTNK